MIFLDIGKILEKGGSRIECVIRAYLDFLISTFLSNSHSKLPTIWTIFLNSQLHLTIPFCLFNSLILQYLPHVTHFPKSLPLSHFPQTVPTLPCIRPFVRLRRHILHDTLRLVWCVCVRPSLYPPQWFPDITWERISNFALLFGTMKCRSSSNFSVIR